MPVSIARRRTKRLEQLCAAAEKFDFNEKYDEPAVNAVLMNNFADDVFARRLLIEWGFLDRTSDGPSYWRIK
jgi:hypothetical protein